MSNPPADLVLRGPEDLPQLGGYVRAQRYRVGLSLANDAAPYLGVGVRLLTELESGTRGTRGVTLRKLLGVLQGLGLELVVRPRSLITSNAASLGGGTRHATDHALPSIARDSSRDPSAPRRETTTPVKKKTSSSKAKRRKGDGAR